ncbi:hypothetical protein CRENBAI_022236 [Crenichthys baileyi]|uniref:Uncharacterized protein n=1 Tax=Crenichthys baileyi TaxID=28760 RepID=A0AAV9QYE0_9TELE
MRCALVAAQKPESASLRRWRTTGGVGAQGRGGPAAGDICRWLSASSINPNKHSPLMPTERQKFAHAHDFLLSVLPQVEAASSDKMNPTLFLAQLRLWSLLAT